FVASGSGQGGGITATCTSGNPTVTLTSAGDFKNGQNIVLPGCAAYGTGQTLLATTITAGGGTTTLTVNPAPTFSSSNNGIVHDDTVAINAALAACATSATGGTVYLPPATWNQNSVGYNLGSGPLVWHGAASTTVNNGCALSGVSRSGAGIADVGGTWRGPGLMYTADSNASAYVGSVFTGAALLTGSGNSFTSASGAYLDFMDAGADMVNLQALTAFTVEGTFKFSSLPGNRMNIISSSGQRDRKSSNTFGFVFYVDTTNKVGCFLTTTSGTQTVVGATTITLNTNHHMGCSWDGSTLRAVLDGTVDGSGALGGTLQIGLPGIRAEEAIKLGDTDNGQGYPYGGALTYSAFGGIADGIRISKVARYTGSYSVPAAKWGAPDGNTLIECNFDNQSDIYTVCRQPNFAGAPVYLPLHYSNHCPGGADSFHVSKLDWEASKHGWFVMPGSDVTIEDVTGRFDWNGIYLGNCSFHQHINRVWLESYGGNAARYLLASDNGIYHYDNIRIGNAGYGLILSGNGVIDNLFVQPGTVNNIIPLMIHSAGNQTIGGIKDTFVLNWASFDIESGAVSNFVTSALFDQTQSVILNGGDYEDQQALSTAPAIQFQGNGILHLHGVGLRSGDSAAAQVHVTDSPTVFAMGVQNASAKPLSDGGTLYVLDGAGAGTLRGFGVGRALANSNVALSAGWGTTATVSGTTGFNNEVTWTVNATGTGQAANPTMTLTWAPTGWATPPGCMANENAGTPLAQVTMTPPTTTNVVLTWNGVPIAGNSYTFYLHCAGQS
ncbi:MAG TPA: LamG-like jellyroll fold domain-containing protein, partial [Candidatus Acidoferrales bacterium]|nr:LamG-like jellyroll fold domain-containing protein [Candidatus Acidoferrales bacterium]